MRTGFSLVELSIVLVILGLLVGGILAGQSLIRAAELRSVSTEYARITTSLHAFRDRYFAIPGDFREATRFWQRMTTTGCTSNSSAALNASGACDGDGNGMLNNGTAVSAPSEPYQLWRHLALAGLIEGSFTGTSGPSGNHHGVIGTNVPASKIGGAGWSWYNLPLAWHQHQLLCL